VSRDRAAGFLACLHAEWTKVRTQPGTFWLLAAAVALTAVVGAVTAAAVSCPAAGCGQDPAKVSLTGVDLGQAVAAIIAILAVTGEYGTGMIRVTLTAMPRRAAMLGAKAVTVTGAVLAAGAAGVALSVLSGRLILPSHGLAMHGAVLRAAAGSVLYLALIALLSLGVAAAVRDAAAAMGVVLGLLYLIPIIATVVGAPSWHRHLEQLAPMTAGLAIQDTTGTPPIGPWTGLGVLAAWAAGALLLGGLLLRLRDA
jgi:ABC-2 type transport system permease protein